MLLRLASKFDSPDHPMDKQSTTRIHMKPRFIISFCVLLLASLATGQRLPLNTIPENYKLIFTPDLSQSSFTGDETIRVRLLKPSSEIVLNSADIEIQEASIRRGGANQKATVTFDKRRRW